MKYVLCAILLATAFGIAGPLLWFTHELPTIPSLIVIGCVGFVGYLLDSTDFLAYVSAIKSAVVCWIKKENTP